MSPRDSLSRTRKGERTKENILTTALELFSKDGYEETTMRAIAESAGVSVGSAYYYFPSKEHLVQAYYMRLVKEHADAARELLEKEKTLRRRIAGVLQTKMDTLEPYHRFSPAIARQGIDPESPLNPFSNESYEARTEAIALWEEVVEGARERIHKDLRKELPEMLWLCSEGIVLYSVYDRTEGRERTRQLIDDSADLLSRLIKMAGLPLIGPVRKLVLRIMKNAAPWRVGPQL